MPKGYWIVDITVRDPEPYKEYVRLDTPIIEGFGGRFVVRGGQNETPEGTHRDRHVVVEFPDYETALACYRSDDYQRVSEIRKANADTEFLIIEGT